MDAIEQAATEGTLSSRGSTARAYLLLCEILERPPTFLHGWANVVTVTPSRLGDFDVEGTLGEGGSSIVYSARLGSEEVALKVIQSEGPISDSERSRFLDEAERMRRVFHPALVSLIGAGFLPDGRPYIAMPRLRGTTLAARSVAPIPVERALQLFEDLARAVGTLHAAGLVHRDIKPQNVFWVVPEDRLILLDLGIAREIDAEPSTTTRAGFSRGTPAYMAPERLFGHPASIRSDLYELTLVLVVMLLGRLPWEEGDPQARLLPTLSGEGAQHIPAPLVATLEGALALDVERRPGSVEELLDRLQRAQPSTLRVGRLDDVAHAPTELHPTPPHPVLLSPRKDTMPSLGVPRGALAGSSPPPPLGRSFALPLVLGALLTLGGVVAGVLIVRSTDKTPSSPAASNSESSRARASETNETREVIEPPGIVSSHADLETAASAPTNAESVGRLGAGSATVRPALSAHAPASNAGSPPIASCALYIALMCDPSTAATPLECSTAKGNVTSWTMKLPSSVARETCQAAYDASKTGLSARKGWKPP